MYRKLFLLLMSSLIITGCSEKAADSNKPDDMLNISAISSGGISKKEYKAELIDITENVEGTAKLEFMYSSNIYVPSSVGEISIAKLSVMDGDMVKAGDTIMVLNRSYDVIAEKETEIELTRKKENFDKLCAEYDVRVNEATAVYDALPNEVNRIALEQITTEYNNIRLTKQAEIDELQLKLDQFAEIKDGSALEIKTDNDGIIKVANNLYEGKSVTEGTVLASVVDAASCYYATDAVLELGKEVELLSENGEKLAGEVVTSSRYLSQIRFSGSQIKLKEELSEYPENVTFMFNPVSLKNVIAIDTKAVFYSSESKPYVMLKKGDSYERKYISVYMEYGNNIIVVDGLSVGDVCLGE